MQPSHARGVVAAGDPHTAAAGAALLAQGGNAADAAVGAMMAAWVAEPVLTGPFGGGFALVAGPEQAPQAYDFFASIAGLGLPPVAPGDGLDFHGLAVSFGPASQLFHVGRGATAVPLLLKGLVALQAEQGRLALAEVVAPALQLARAGVPLSAQVAPIAKILTPILSLTPATAALFAPGGTVLAPGAYFRSPGLAELLEQLAAGADVDALQAALLPSFGPPHGRLTAADLAAAQVVRQAPLQVQLGAASILLNPPPSLGGLLVGHGLNLLKSVPASVWADETETALALLGCLAATQAARAELVDPAACRGVAALVGLDAALASPPWQDAGQRLQTATRAHGLAGAAASPPSPGSTTHVSCVDAQGLACSITSSNGEGCGHLVRGGRCHGQQLPGRGGHQPSGLSRAAGRRAPDLHDVSHDRAAGGGAGAGPRHGRQQPHPHRAAGGAGVPPAVRPAPGRGGGAAAAAL